MTPAILATRLSASLWPQLTPVQVLLAELAGRGSCGRVGVCSVCGAMEVAFASCEDPVLAERASSMPLMMLMV